MDVAGFVYYFHHDQQFKTIVRTSSSLENMEQDGLFKVGVCPKHSIAVANRYPAATVILLGWAVNDHMQSCHIKGEEGYYDHDNITA